MGVGGSESAPCRVATRVEVRYDPVFELSTGRLAGADAAAGDLLGRGGGGGDEVLALVRSVLDDLRRRPAALDRWWVCVEVGLAPLVDRSLCAELDLLQRTSGGLASRLRFGLDQGDVALASVAGGLGRLVEHGARLDVGGAGAPVVPGSLGPVPVSTVRVQVATFDPRDGASGLMLASLVGRARTLGIDVVAVGIDDDAHLDLAQRSGVGLVQGPWLGTGGSLEKLLTIRSR